MSELDEKLTHFYQGYLWRVISPSLIALGALVWFILGAVWLAEKAFESKLSYVEIAYQDCLTVAGMTEKECYLITKAPQPNRITN